MNYYKLSVNNISKYGDTDIFPYPIENALFYDLPDNVVSIMETMDNKYEEWYSKYSVDSIKTCVPIGYTGFRWATIIDPIWNAYLLSEVLKISEEVEKARIPVHKQAVFSYRIKLDENTDKIFDDKINWREYYNSAISIAGDFDYVVRFDISDFYNRIYHHRLENALFRLKVDRNIIIRIMKILQGISNNVSYGLPIGGNAARILAELLLNSMDQLMIQQKIKFCRFVDDYILFTNSKELAYRNLNYCAEFLLRNEGLGIQKDKTQIQTSSEFISHAKAVLDGEDETKDKEKASFMKIHLKYDPYSLTANEDYADLKAKLQNYDILAMIKAEIKKSRIHLAFGKHLLNAVHLLEGEALDLAFNLISSNLEALYPIFPSVMHLANKKLLNCNDSTICDFSTTLCSLVENDSYMIQTDNNASYVARVLSLVNTENSIQSIQQLSHNNSALVKTNCLYAMTNLNNLFWLSDIKNNFSTLSKWERRAFIASSFYLGDEGRHWREHTKHQFTDLELLLRDWVASKNPIQKSWRLPL